MGMQDEVALLEVLQQNLPKVMHDCRQCVRGGRRRWLLRVPVGGLCVSGSIVYR
jgi:hypothetical protein